MSTQNSYLRRPITLHRRTKTVLFNFAKHRRRGRHVVYRPGRVFRIGLPVDKIRWIPWL